MSGEDPARRLFESFGIEASDGDLAALAKWEADIRADERAALTPKMEALLEHEDVAGELIHTDDCPVQQAIAARPRTSLPIESADCTCGLRANVRNVRALVEEARGGE